MRTLSIGTEEAGRKLDRYLMKIFPNAPKSFLYKSLRTNKIKVNGHKPLDLNYILEENDVISIYFTEEQWGQFGKAETALLKKVPTAFVPILYEDDNLLILNKPGGMLSQKDHTGIESLNEIGLQMLRSQGMEFGKGFVPGVCNRLDRNTAGAVIMAKNLKTAQAVQKIISDKSLGKFYSAVVEGWIPWEQKKLVGYWIKDERTNKVRIFDEAVEGSQRIECICRRITTGGDYSLAEIRLLTGKGHQIRAQLAKEGYPIVGDAKYGGAAGKGQLLCADRLLFPRCPEPLVYMSGKEIAAPWPVKMEKFVKRFIIE